MSAAQCPICGRQRPVPRYRPFCSARCGEVDLHRWLVGAYTIPMQDMDGIAESDAAGEPEDFSRSSSSPHSAEGENTRETE